MKQSWNSARERGKSVSCINNHKLLMNITQMYMDAHDEYIPNGSGENGIRIGYLHNNAVNTSFVDGHAETITRKIYVDSWVRRSSNLPQDIRFWAYDLTMTF